MIMASIAHITILGSKEVAYRYAFRPEEIADTTDERLNAYLVKAI